MADSSENKRKRHSSPGNGGERRTNKKSKGSSAGKWRTKNHQQNISKLVVSGSSLDVGFEGVWATHVRGLERKAVAEFMPLCHEYGKLLWGVPLPEEEDAKAAVGPKDGGDGVGGDDGDDSDDDIETSIRKELDEMKAKTGRAPKTDQTFTPIPSGMDCIFFVRTKPPVNPIELARRICADASDCRDIRQRKCRHINRLTPVSLVGKASESGIQRVAYSVLSSVFSLVDDDSSTTTGGEAGSNTKEEGAMRPAEGTGCSYAIRPNIRNHSSLKSKTVIDLIANMIDKRHKVNLGSPDKVILVDVFASFCGMSVVDGPEYEALKRFNMNEIYKAAAAAGEPAGIEASV